MKRTNRDEYLPLSMFEELTVEPSSFVYLISLPCWRKPKWKWHRFQRICNSSELKTTRPAKHVILSLRGWARHPQEQTGLGFVFAWVPVCASERASGGALQQKALSSTPVEKSKWVLFPFCVLIEEPRYGLIFSQQGNVYVLMPLWACMLLFACTVFNSACVCVCVASHCSSMIIRGTGVCFALWIQMQTYIANCQPHLDAFTCVQCQKRKKRP